MSTTGQLTYPRETASHKKISLSLHSHHSELLQFIKNQLTEVQTHVQKVLKFSSPATSATLSDTKESELSIPKEKTEQITIQRDSALTHLPFTPKNTLELFFEIGIKDVFWSATSLWGKGNNGTMDIEVMFDTCVDDYNTHMMQRVDLFVYTIPSGERMCYRKLKKNGEILMSISKEELIFALHDLDSWEVYTPNVNQD